MSLEIDNLHCQYFPTMKRSIFIIAVLLCIFHETGRAQSFKVAYDTVYINVTSDTAYYDNVTNLLSSPITISWKVVATNFPSDWLALLAFCDNKNCYYNASGTIWPGATTFTSIPIAGSSTGVFDNVTDLRSTTSRGCYFVTVRLSNTAIPTDTAYETFEIKCPTNVNTIPSEANNVKLYPNPATDNLTIRYSSSAGAAKICVYNTLGKMIANYKITDTTITNIPVSNLATGIYFIRLTDDEGNVVAIQKFSKE